uniref:Uncharacterized protein n=1 Tax=Opuntia streptacantha TaxID=393608 RepID=A0A7C8ZI50_OPUST
MNSNFAADAAGPDLEPQFGFLGSSELMPAGIEFAATFDSESKQGAGKTRPDSAGSLKETGQDVYQLLDPVATSKMSWSAVYQDADPTLQDPALVASRVRVHILESLNKA